MPALAFVVIWVAQATVLGLVALVLPRLLRVHQPSMLEPWWACAALGVVALPILPLLLPASPTPPPALVSFVESTTIALSTPSSSPRLLSPLAWLAIGWASGVCARLTWLALGQRRLRRVAAAGVPIEDDPALVRARQLAAAHPTPLRSGAQAPVIVTPSTGPCVFGWRRPSVLVPAALADLPEAQRVSVYLHELLHAVRLDVQRGYADEVWRLAWWWQPAVWWMLARLRLAREHQVDRSVVAATGARRPYVEALMWCGARREALALSPQVGGPHALVGRVAALCEEVEMSRLRVGLTIAGLVLVFSVAGAVIGMHSPLGATARVQEGGTAIGPGPLERVAVLPTLDAPAPPRTLAVEPVWGEPAAYRFRVHLVLDDGGRVAEARIVGTPLVASAPEDLRRPLPAAREAALEAVRQWQFAPPARAPMLLAADVIVGDPRQVTSSSAGPRDSSASAREPLRVGGTIGPPRKVHDVQPEYPQVALDGKVQGVVIIECTVDHEGHVAEARVLRSIPLLDQAALDAVRQWRYTPTLLNGEAVPVVMTVTVNFTLQ